jgi:hypothetical protein
VCVCVCPCVPGDLAGGAACSSARSVSAVLSGFVDHAAHTLIAALPFVTYDQEV